MQKRTGLNEAKLLTERSKMVSEILLDVWSEQQSECRNINAPLFKVFDLVNKPQKDDKFTVIYSVQE
jgi:hypothetical protein